MASGGRSSVELVVDTKRIYLLFFAVLVCFGALTSRLWFLQVLKGHQFTIASERNRFREIPLPAPRGVVYDHGGDVILSNRPFFDLVVIPQYLENEKETLKILSDIFHIPLETIQDRLKEAARMPKFVPIRIKRNLSLHEVAIVESTKFFLPGVDIDTVPRRDYGRSEPAHLLGYLGEVGPQELDTLNRTVKTPEERYRIGSLIGKKGIEKKYEIHLRGMEGVDYVQVDARGRLQSGLDNYVDMTRTLKPRRGKDVYLTIDRDVQRVAAEAFRNKNGAVIAVNAQTGAVIAYVSHPDIDLATYQSGLTKDDWQSLQTNPFKPLLDKVTGGAYPPGSVYKAITAIAALEENVVTPDKTYYCNGSFSLGRGRWGCWKKEGHGPVALKRALEQSCDVYFYQVGHLLGVDKIAKWAKAFGLGEKTDLNLNMEVTGLAPTPDWKLRTQNIPWQQGDTINMSIGQGYNLVTPIQVALMYAAMGNGGKVLRPYLVDRVLNERGQVVYQESPHIRRQVQLSERTLSLVKQGLFDVVNAPTGTGRKAQVPGFTVSGKTGTAQTAALRKAEEQEDVTFLQRDHAWFAAYSPSDVPEIAVAVLSEYDGRGGGAQAAPIAQKVIEAYWRKRHPEKFPKVEANTEAPIELKRDMTRRPSDEVLPGEQIESPVTPADETEAHAPEAAPPEAHEPEDAAGENPEPMESD